MELFPSEIRAFARFLVAMQHHRHEADYDPMASCARAQVMGLIPIQHDYGVSRLAGKASRASRIQSQPHSRLTRSGWACHAFRTGSRASCLACRVG